MKRLSLKEAGNYANLTTQEKQMLANASPDIRGPLANVVSSLRAKGKKIDLMTAAQQMQQIPHFANDPNLKNFVSVAGLQNAKPAPNPFKPAMNVPKPPSFLNQQAQQRASALPQSPAQSPGDQFEQMRQSNVSNDERIASQKQGQGAPLNQAQRLNALRNKKVSPFAKTEPPVAEAFNPAMMNSSLKNILATISKLRPEELSAISQMVNSLMTSKRGSSMGTTMEHKKIVTEAIKVKLTEQILAKNTAERLLEGPLSNVWDKIKGAGTALAGQMGVGPGMQQPPGVDENAKRVAQELTKLLGKVNQYRQKFNSSILKNSEAMNGYHDLVLNAVEAYQQSQNMLGPFGQQIVRQIHDAVGNLVYDLKSEKDQIDTFLKQLKDAGMAKVGGASISKQQQTLDPTMLGAAAKKKAQASRVEENPGGVSANRRAMPFGGGKMDPSVGDDLEKSQALAKAKMGSQFGDIGTQQNAMNDMAKLFMKQIKREKESKSKKSSKK